MKSYFNFNFGDEDFLSSDFISNFEESFKNIVKKMLQESDFQRDLIGINFQDDEQEEIQEEKEARLEEETDARVFHVPPSYLPHGKFWKALGLYVPYSHTIYIANNLPLLVEKFVYYHEIAHSLGIMDEEEADKFAAKKCGYYINLGMPRGFILRY